MFFCVFYNTMPKNRSIPIVAAARILTHLMSLNSFSSLPVIFIVSFCSRCTIVQIQQQHRMYHILKHPPDNHELLKQVRSRFPSYK